MALAIDGSTPALASTPTAASVTTASFTPPNGSLIVLLIGLDTNNVGDDPSVTTVTNTGTAITWTRRARKCVNAASTGGAGTDAGSEIWTGVGTGGAITVTVTGAMSGTNYDKTVQAEVLTGANTSSLSNVAASFSTSGLPSVTVTGCTAGSYVFAVASDWAQAGLGTAGSGQTIITEYNVAGAVTIHNWRTTNTLSSSGSQTMNLTAPSAEKYNECAIEILDANPPSAGASVVQAAQQFPPFAPPYVDPHAVPFQLLGDSAGAQSITLTDTGTADDSSFVVTVSVPLTDTGAADDSSFSVSNLDPNQALPAVAWMFLEPSAASFQLLGDATTNAATPITLTDAGAAADTLSVNITDYGSPVNLTGPFPPFAPPFTQPMAVPFQQLGDASGQTFISLTDTAAADDTSLTVTAAVPLSDTGAGADAVTVTAAVPLTEAGAADDSSLTIAAAVPLTDAGAAADSISILVAGQPDPYQAPVLQFPPFTAPFIEPTAIPFQLLGDASAAAQISLTDTGAADDTSLTVTASVPLTDSGVAADAATVTAATPLADTASAADTLAAAATVPLTDTGSADDSSFTVLVQVDSPQPFRYFVPFGPPFWAMAADTPLQLLGDATGPPAIPIIPPITVTGSSSSAVSVVGASTAATTVTGSSAPAITVR